MDDQKKEGMTATTSADQLETDAGELRTVRVAMIGAGGMAARVHYPSLAVLPGVEFAGICDLNPERLQLIGRDRPVRRRGERLGNQRQNQQRRGIASASGDRPVPAILRHGAPFVRLPKLTPLRPHAAHTSSRLKGWRKAASDYC